MLSPNDRVSVNLATGIKYGYLEFVHTDNDNLWMVLFDDDTSGYYYEDKIRQHPFQQDTLGV